MSEQQADVEIRDNTEYLRYEARLGGRVAGFSQYRIRPGHLVFIHTKVDPAYEGRGIGSRLVRWELDDVRRRGLKVVPVCPFVRAFIRRHDEYADLLLPAAEEQAAEKEVAENEAADK